MVAVHQTSSLSHRIENAFALSQQNFSHSANLIRRHDGCIPRYKVGVMLFGDLPSIPKPFGDFVSALAILSRNADEGMPGDVRVCIRNKLKCSKAWRPRRFVQKT